MKFHLFSELMVGKLENCTTSDVPVDDSVKGRSKC